MCIRDSSGRGEKRWKAQKETDGKIAFEVETDPVSEPWKCRTEITTIVLSDLRYKSSSRLVISKWCATALEVGKIIKYLKNTVYV